MNFNPTKNSIKLKTHNIINKRRTLSEILSESEKNEAFQILKKKAISKILNKQNENHNINEDLNLEEKKEKQNMMKKGIKPNDINHQKIVKNSEIINKITRHKNRKITINANLPKRYFVFKKIIEYLESNNIPLFELLRHNPFQSKPYQISKGYEFLEAVKFKNYEFVTEALQKSTDYLFVFDYYGQTCYHWAAKLGNIKMLRILLDYGLHHNQKDFKGRTPLYLAAVNNNREVCDLLLRNKANIHLKDNCGNSASDVAGSKELKYYLGDILAQPFSNPVYKKKVADFLRKREEKILKEKTKQRLLEIERERRENEQFDEE